MATPKTIVTLRLDPDTYSAVKAICDAQSISVTAFVDAALKAAVKRTK